jgi:hypothetical protein
MVMGVFLLMMGAFLIMGGLQVFLVFAVYGLVAAILISASMTIGKVFLRL